MLWLAVLLLLQLQPQVGYSHQHLGKCNLSSLEARPRQMVPVNTSRNRVRSWHTKIMGQYSPLTHQLVVLFGTPPWSHRIGQYRVKLAACGPASGRYKLVNQSDSGSVHRPAGTNVTLITIDIGPESKSRLFGLCLELWTFADGAPVVARAVSPMFGACHVSMAPQTPDTEIANKDALPDALAEHLWRRYHLVATDACCLAYVDGGGVDGGGGVGGSTGGGAVSAELIALCYIGSVSVLCCALLVGACCLTGGKTPQPLCLRLCQEIRIRRYRHKWRPPPQVSRYSLPDLCAPPYLHLLTHCKAVDTGQRLSAFSDGDMSSSTAV